jgi:diadenylate cyclase
MNISDGGFKINDDYSPSKIYELAKMDNAIIISEDTKKIILANTQLLPDPKISTRETGSRHRTAERVARQTGKLVISISQRRGIITLFKGNLRYVLKDTMTVLNKTNQALQTLEKYKLVFDNYVHLLNEYEFDDIVMLENVIVAIQRAEMILRMVPEIEISIAELGTEGRLLALQLKEILGDTEFEEQLILKDYLIRNKKTKFETILEEINNLTYEELMENKNIIKILGYDSFDNISEIAVVSKGYRILNKIPKMPSIIIDNLIKKFKNLNGIVDASIDDLDEVDGIGEVRAQNINQSLRKMKEQYLYIR